ncbi:MAG: hypothetical protein ABI388_11645 [Bacteroidia bacterium]
METIKHSQIGLVSSSNISSNGWFNRQVDGFENARFGWMAMLIIIQSCLGSVACMYVLKNNASDVMLVAGAVVTMASNSVLIAQGSGKLCLSFFYISIVVNAILILLNF